MSRVASIPLHYRAAGWLARRRFQSLWRALYLISLRGLGYNNWISSINGEDRFARGWAREHAAQPVVIFDVGANKGDFTATFLPLLTCAKFYLFEPNPKTFQHLSRRYLDDSRIVLEAQGVGAQPGSLPLYDFKNGKGSERASFLIESFSEILHVEAEGVAAPIVTLDGYAQAAGIGFIDLLKIDTEGFEKDVLTGARALIAENRIGAVQLEMGEHNVVSGLSLYALTKLLPGFDLYRIVADGLVPMVCERMPYTAAMDMPRYCNMVAINRTPRKSS